MNELYNGIGFPQQQAFNMQPTIPQVANYQNQGYGNLSFQPPVQQRQNSVLPGKIVESFEVFKTIDIPMDGNIYYFPKADGTELYTKKWLPNGTTLTLTYRLKEDENGVSVETNDNDLIIEKLNMLDEKIAKIEKMFSKPSNNGRGNKKEELE